MRRSLRFEALEDRRMLAGVEFVGPLPTGKFDLAAFGCVNTQDVSVSVVGMEMRGESLVARFRVHTGGADPVQVVLGAFGQSTREYSGKAPLDESSMINKRQIVVLSRDTDFVIVGTPSADNINFEANSFNPSRLNDVISAGHKGEQLFTMSIEDGLDAFVAGKTQGFAKSWLGADVNGDGFNSPVDALAVINYFNSGKTAPEGAGTLFLESEDVNGDGKVTPIDALLVVNVLNDAARDAAFAAYDS